MLMQSGNASMTVPQKESDGCPRNFSSVAGRAIELSAMVGMLYGGDFTTEDSKSWFHKDRTELVL